MHGQVLWPKGRPIGLLVFLHGYASGPEYLKPYLGFFLEKGFAVFTPTAPDHGGRGTQTAYPTVEEPEALLAHASAVIEAWIHELAEQIPAWQKAEGLPLYAAGFSMGAYVWHELISRKLARPVAAALFGMGAVPNVLPPEGVELPSARAHAYPPTALLQLHGKDDRVVPPRLVEETLAALRPAYAGLPGRLGAVYLEGVGHAITPAMAALAAGWLGTWGEDAKTTG